MTHPKLATPRSGYGGRGYRIPGRGNWDALDSKNKPKWTQTIYPSVTTVLKSVAKPGIMQWIADQTAAFAVANLSYLQMVTEEIGWGYLRWFWSREPDLVATELRTHHEGVKNDAAELGTNIHEWIEAEIDGTVLHPDLIARESDEMVEQFLLWVRGHHIVSHNAEFTLVNDRLGVAGTADADWTITCLHDGPTCLGQPEGEGVRTLIDLKSSRNTWPEHGMQIAILNSCEVMMREVPEGFEGAVLHKATVEGRVQKSWWIEEVAPTFDRQALLHIRPSDLDPSGETIPAFCHLIDMTDDIDVYMQGFVGALALTEMTHTLEQRAKARKIETEK